MANAAVSPWFNWIQKAEADGVLEQVLGQLDFNILSTLKLNGFERNEIITETPGCRNQIGFSATVDKIIHQQPGFSGITDAFDVLRNQRL